jgi:hypothetical protein
MMGLAPLYNRSKGDSSTSSKLAVARYTLQPVELFYPILRDRQQQNAEGGIAHAGTVAIARGESVGTTCPTNLVGPNPQGDAGLERSLCKDNRRTTQRMWMESPSICGCIARM